MKKFNLLFIFLLINFVLFVSCESELQQFKTIAYVPCSESNVIVDNTILSDFECQNNTSISSVMVVRNPSEIGINTSKFVGEYIDGTATDDGFVIDISSAVSLQTNAFFNLKIKSKITGTMLIQLQGGTATEASFTETIIGDNNWVNYLIDLSEEAEEDHKEIKIIFNSGVQTSGNDVYYIDDLELHPTIDPCEGVTQDLSIINDFDCQQNIFVGDPQQPESIEIVSNPQKNSINNSDFVGLYKDDGTQPFDALIVDFNGEIDLTNPIFKIKVNASRTGNFLVKLEGGTPVEVARPITLINQWVEYSFNFNSAINNGNTRMVLFFNAGATNGTIEDNYYLDDLRFDEFTDPCIGITPDLNIISDFECQQNYDLGLNLANPKINIVDNPNGNTVNNSDLVGEYTDDGTDPYDFLTVDFNGVIDLSTNSELNIKVYSNIEMPIIAKLEGGTTPFEVTAQVDVINEWKNYTFDFSGAVNANNTRLVLFLNAGATNGTATDIYYIDDILFTENSSTCGPIVANCTGVTQDLSIISDFDCQQNYTLGATPGSSDAPVVQNPNISCENRSSNVGQYTDNGTDPYDALFIDLGSVIDLSTKNQLKIKVLTPNAIPILAKLEGGTPVEVQVSANVVNEWAEYTFDFSGAIGNGNDKLVFFFNAGNTNGTATDIYHIDDIRFE